MVQGFRASHSQRQPDDGIGCPQKILLSVWSGEQLIYERGSRDKGRSPQKPVEVTMY